MIQDRVYHFRVFRSSISVVSFFLKSKTTIAKPTVTSAAATIMVKNTTTCPERSPRNDEKLTNDKFAELRMSSIESRTIKIFLRTKMPKRPIEKRMAEMTR